MVIYVYVVYDTRIDVEWIERQEYRLEVRNNTFGVRLAENGEDWLRHSVHINI